MISTDIRESAADSVLCWLATVSPDREPNVSPKEAFLIDNTGEIMIAHIASPKSVANIKSNSKVCVTFIDIFTQRGYKVMGEARFVEPHADEFVSRSESLSKMVGGDHEILGVIVIEPKSVDDVVAPSYNIHPETTFLDMIEQSLSTYRVNHYQRVVEQDAAPNR